MSKILNQVLKEINNKDIILESIDVEDDDDAAIFYNIRSLPTIVLLKDDNEVFRIIGTKNKEELKEIIEKYV